MHTPITVTTLNNQIKSLIESHFLNVYVEGELSRVTYHSSGHIYFNLKDENSTISCVMFKGNSQNLKFKLEDGMAVIVNGAITLYTPRGSYQINCFLIEPVGSGALALAYEQLKIKLQKKGYFDQSIKKKLPKFPSHVALLTSKSGAALQDMLRVATSRWPLVKFTLIDTLVQGKEAAKVIAQNIYLADEMGFDIIVIARGGGSLEDLWAFNEEIVADAIYKAKTPIVSAIGHEIDFLISDFVADLRAATPSAAMEIILPDINEIRIFLDSMQESFHLTYKNILYKKNKELTHLKELFDRHLIENRVLTFENEIKILKERYDSSITQLFLQKSMIIKNLFEAFSANDPAKRDKFGFAQISKNGKKVSLESLQVDDIFELSNSKTTLSAKVLTKP